MHRLTLIIAFEDIRNSVARSLTILLFPGISSPASNSLRARCKAEPCFETSS